jgi:hypothetical protein
MRLRWLAVLVPWAFAVPATAGDLNAADRARPHLDVAAMPRMAISPSNVAFTAKLVGGQDVEDFHCPEVEWDWSDGTRSTRLSDCDPYQPGDDVVRRFSANHRYRQPGEYAVTVRLRRAEGVVAAATITIEVKQGLPGSY